MTVFPSSPQGGAPPFPTIFDLRSAHRQLLQQQRGGAALEALSGDVMLFVERARRTGAFLDVDEHRDSAQGLIDYWTTTLYRTAIKVPETDLADFDPALAPTLDDSLCPYVGLTAFDELTSDRFFGRERMIRSAAQHLATERFLAILGPSGSGKSSILLGGIVPMLRAGGIEGSSGWRYVPTMVPGSDPVANLTAALGTTDVGGDQPVVIVVDQFEELFTLCESDAKREAFVATLLRFLDTPSPRHTVLVTMRTDYEMHLSKVPRLQELFEQGELRATPLSAAELREAVEKPAERIGLKFESGVVDTLVADVLGEPAALPLLQFTLLRLWQERDHNRITLAAYRKIGGSRAALSRAADALYAQLLPEDQTIMRKIFLRMVRPAAGEETTRRRIRVNELEKIGHAPQNVERVVAKLVESRLVRRSPGETPDDDQIEVAHEALIRNWPLLVTWLEDTRAQLLRLRRFEALAEEWERFNRQYGFLDEKQVQDAEEWMASDEAADIGVSESLAALVAASRTAIEERRRSDRRVRTIVIAVGVLLVSIAMYSLLRQNIHLKRIAAAEKKAVEQERAAAAKDAELKQLQLQRGRQEAEMARKYEEQKRRDTEELVADLQVAVKAAETARQDAEKRLSELQATRERLAQETKETDQLEQVVAKLTEVAAPPPTEYVIPESGFAETPPARLLASPDRLGLRRAGPIRLGSSIGAAGGGTGSVCCLVQNRAGERFLLSLQFVVGEVGTRVIHPGSGDGKGQPVGTVVRAGASYNAGALVRLDPKVQLQLAGSQFSISGVERQVRIDDQVRMIGRGSGLVMGTVIARRDGEYVTNIDSQPGDAGAPVVNSRNELVGILYANADKGRHSLFLPIGPILNELEVTLVPSPAP